MTNINMTLKAKHNRRYPEIRIGDIVKYIPKEEISLERACAQMDPLIF